ncbi:MAG TPA: hypothetical protein VGP58_10885 [Pyrinomonadaceae bacterium]|nr:hypothetical protein [Pyrinomonadaceae bacterium]
MLSKKKFFIWLTFLTLAITFAVPSANAKGGEYKAVVKHLKTKYQAKKVKIPFVWLARFAVSVVRPAGVKSFSVTIFEDLKFSRETLDEEMQTAMRNSFSADWSPILRVRSRTGEQVYMYMREAGKSVKLAVVTIDKEQAAVIRATFSPDKLAEFINNPKIFGISLDDNKQQATNKISEPKENVVMEEKNEVQKKDN